MFLFCCVIWVRSGISELILSRGERKRGLTTTTLQSRGPTSVTCVAVRKDSESQREKLLSLEIDNVVEIDRNSSVGCRNWKSTRADAACPPVGIYSSAIAWGIFSRRYYGIDLCCDLCIISIVRLRCLELV